MTQIKSHIKQPQTPRTQGFTLIELLIGLALLGIILLLINQLFINTARDTQFLMSNAELYTEAQIAQQILVGRISEALYIWPTGSTLQLSNAGASTCNTVISPQSQKWIVGTQPFIAMILPPEQPEYHNRLPTGCTAHNTQACYRFFAYFPMLRHKMRSAFSSAKPPADEQNKNQWVIMQYRANLYDGNSNSAWYPSYTDKAVNTNNLPAPHFYRGNKADFLVDYVEPDSFSIEITPPTGSNIANGKVVLELALERHARNREYQVGGTDEDRLGAELSPRNWF